LFAWIQWDSLDPVGRPFALVPEHCDVPRSVLSLLACRTQCCGESSRELPCGTYRMKSLESESYVYGRIAEARACSTYFTIGVRHRPSAPLLKRRRSFDSRNKRCGYGLFILVVENASAFVVKSPNNASFLMIAELQKHAATMPNFDGLEPSGTILQQLKVGVYLTLGHLSIIV